MKNITLAITLFTINLLFSQVEKFNYNLVLQNPENYPFYSAVIEKVNDKNVLKSEYKYIDSLNFYGLNYKSFDNLRIGGFLVEPKKHGNYPVLIFNRGGNASFGTIKFDFLAKFLGKIASKGYIVIGSQLRGSEVSEGLDEFGGKDVYDALDILKIIDNLPNADASRIGVFGWSRGVMTNFLMLKQTNRIKTNIAIAGQADLINTKRKEMFEVYKARIPYFEKDSILALKNRSSLLAIELIQNNALSNFIIQGNKDTKVDIRNAFELNSKLNENNFSTRLLVYENEDHGLLGVTSDLLKQIENWLKQKL